MGFLPLSVLTVAVDMPGGWQRPCPAALWESKLERPRHAAHVQEYARIPSIIASAMQIISGAVFVGEGVMMGYQAWAPLAISSVTACSGMLLVLRLNGTSRESFPPISPYLTSENFEKNEPPSILSQPLILITMFPLLGIKRRSRRSYRSTNRRRRRPHPDFIDRAFSDWSMVFTLRLQHDPSVLRVVSSAQGAIDFRGRGSKKRGRIRVLIPIAVRRMS